MDRGRGGPVEDHAVGITGIVVVMQPGRQSAQHKGRVVDTTVVDESHMDWGVR